MSKTASAYKRLLQALRPRGRAWRQGDPLQEQLFAGWAEELARVDSRVDDFLREADVSTTVELITEHEEDYGLIAGALSIAERQTALLAKLVETGTLTKDYYIGLAAVLGYTITIDEYVPAWAGIWTAGQPCGDQQNLFFWTVNISYVVSDSPAFVSYDNLIQLFNQIKPAHTTIIYQLSGPGFSNGFSAGFFALPSMNQSMGGFNIGFGYGFNVIPTEELNGGFSTDFSSGFKVCYGGAFDGAGFDFGFNKIYDAFPYNGGGFDNISFGNGFDKRIQF